MREMTALESYIELLREILQYRWSVEPEKVDVHRRALRELAMCPVSDALDAYMKIAVLYLRAMRERERREPDIYAGCTSPVWEGWNAEEDAWLLQMEEAHEKLSESEKRWAERRFNEFDHTRAMDKAMKSIHQEKVDETA